VVWLGLIILCAIAAVGIEVVNRLYYIRVADGRLSWRLGQKSRGERPLSAVRGIERMGYGARILFSDGEHLLVGGVEFRAADLDRLIAAVDRVEP